MEYRDLRASIKTDIKCAYEDYTSKCESSINDDPRKFWTFINSKRKTSAFPSIMICDNVTYSSPSDISTGFARYFHSVYLPSSRYSTFNQTDLSHNHILLTSVAQEDILESISNIKANLSSGPDMIPGMLLRDCAHPLSRALFHLFNLSLQSNTFPDCWKITKFTPIYKSGDVADLKNYRPIAGLSHVSKVFEKIIYRCIYNTVKGSISNSQHGFMKKRSTTTNLTYFTHFVSSNIDSNTQVDCIYTDFSKAFDRIDHGILLNKLQLFSLSFPLLSLLSSYLTNRYFYVQILGHKSSAFHASSGVPQGSILGPLLFLLFINDITDSLACHKLLFADDLKIFHTISTMNDCNMLQKDLTELSLWCSKNLFTINIQKCKVVSFTRKQSPITFNYSIDQIVLPCCTSVNDLGILFDSKLTFVSHINSIFNTSLRMLGFIIRNSRQFKHISTLFTVFNSFVRSKLEYCCTVWNPRYDVHCDQLELIQSKFLKYVYFKTHGSYPSHLISYKSLLKMFGIHSLQQRRDIHSTLFLSKLIHSDLDDPNSLGLIPFHTPAVHTRKFHSFYLPTPRTNMLFTSPILRACFIYETTFSNVDIFRNKPKELRAILLRSQ